MKRYFEFEGEDSQRGIASSAKFWEVSVTGSDVTVRFGKIGSAGQTKVKHFGDEAQAEAEAEALIAAKVKKGYEEKAAAD